MTAIKISLGGVATVRPGYLNRSRIEPDPQGTHLLIQGKDISEDSDLLLNQATRFSPKREPALYAVNRGDTLVVARGQPHTAHSIEQDLENVLAAATFYIVRPTDKRVSARFLTWWLNLPEIQAEIDSRSRGTNIAYVRRKAIEELEILLPPLPTQHRIAQAVTLWRRIRSIQSQIDARREQYIQAVCRQAIHGKKEH